MKEPRNQQGCGVVAMPAAVAAGTAMLTSRALQDGQPIQALPELVPLAAMLVGLLITILGILGMAFSLLTCTSCQRDGLPGKGGERETPGVDWGSIGFATQAIVIGGCLCVFGLLTLRGSAWARLALEITFVAGAAHWIGWFIWVSRDVREERLGGSVRGPWSLSRWCACLVPAALLGGCGAILQWGG